jgi:hypothetical protein
MATAVTQSVPSMKGKKPNSPFIGDHADEKNNLSSGTSDNIGIDF